MNSAKHINVPVSLIRRFRGNKEALEMLACAFIIKAKYQHSVLYDVDCIKAISNTFGVSYKKAKALVHAMKESELFIYNEKKSSLFAKTFKDKTIKRYGKKKKYDAISDYCYKLQYTDGMALRMVMRQLRNILALCVIHANEIDTCNVGINSNDSNGTKQGGKRVIPQRKIASAIGLSRSSACRYIKKMVEQEIVGKTQMVAECVIPVLNDETERQYRERKPNVRYRVWHDIKSGGWSAWVFLGCEYSILKRDVANRFRNVIHNFVYKGTQLQPTMSCELDGENFWNKFN